MQRRHLAWFLLAGLVLGPAVAARAAEGDGSEAAAKPEEVVVRPQEILEVIEGLKARFLKTQKADGSWEESSWPYAPEIVAGGETAIISWSLLQAGQDPFSDPIHRAIRSLVSTRMLGTYNRSLRCMVLASLARIDPTGKYAKATQEDADFLLQSRHRNGRWSYFHPGAAQYKSLASPDGSFIGDNSNTQFAVLALREAAVSGAKVPLSAWRDIRDYWLREQLEDGGFSYRKDGWMQSYGSMTAAGTASMFISEEMARTAQCCSGEVPGPIVDALTWLSEHFSATENPKHGSSYWMYWLYSVERVTETSGYRTFGSHDWFRSGARAIVDAYRTQSFSKEPSDGAFALIFLAKGVAPIVCNKLEFGEGWNPNPLDAMNVTRYLGAEVFERHLNWQIVRLDEPLTSFHEAPILLITTKKWPEPNDPLIEPLRAKIREFCETGGTLLIDHTCTPDPQFHGNLSAFLESTWPGWRFRSLPANHPLYSAHFTLETRTALEALGNGCREYVFVCDSVPPPAGTQPAGTQPAATAPATAPAAQQDLSCTWQKTTAKRQPAAFQIAANLYMYATDKSFRNKIEPPSNLPRQAGPATTTVSVGHVQHTNNWNACPLALPMLSQALIAQDGLGLNVSPVTLDAAKLAGRKVLFISGQGKVAWTPEQIAAVRDYIRGGGCVLADALMGDREFAESLRRLAAGALEAPVRPIPDNDPLMTGEFGEKAFSLRKVQYSRTLRWRKGVAGPASLEGVRAKGRWAFVISPYDLTNGLTTAKPYGSLGYEPDDATRIAANCMMYFAKPTSATATQGG